MNLESISLQSRGTVPRLSIVEPQNGGFISTDSVIKHNYQSVNGDQGVRLQRS